MAIIPPRLDDRAFEDLRAELIRRIPVHAPEWTDHNAADPGIALIELFAALGDNLLYRFNRVPEAARLEFLRLLAVPPRPARPALAQVRLDPPEGALGPVDVDFSAGSRLVLAAGEVEFEAIEEVTPLPVELGVWIKRDYQGDLVANGLANVTSLLEAHFSDAPGAKAGAAAPPPSPYEAVALAPPQAGNLPAVLSTAASIDGYLWLCLLAPEKSLKAASRDDPARGLALLRRNISGCRLNLGTRPDDSLCGTGDHKQCPEPGHEPPRWPLLWEISTGAFSSGIRRVDHARYRRLDVVSDTSGGLDRPGTVRLRLPDAVAGEAVFGDWTADSFQEPDPDLLGVGPLPPRLEDETLAARVLAWVRVSRPNPDHPPIAVRWLDANAVGVRQAVGVPQELLGYGNGRTGQRYALSRTPVLPDSARIQVRAGNLWENWQRVDDLALAGPDDPFYTLDPSEGTVTFGDGIHGRIPLPGEAIRVQAYSQGGGNRGNVGAGRIQKVRRGNAVALQCRPVNPLPAEGGLDAETQAAAAERIPSVLRHRDRAVAAQDFVDLALETPDTPVGRAHVLPRHKPHERIEGVPGTVTLIVLPAYDPLHPDTPTPDRDMLRKVCTWLEPRRLVTTELYVTPPEYVPVACSIAVEALPGTGEETLRRYVELALRQHLAPLPPYGPEGSGWPFGRRVDDRDLEAAALRVQGVRLVSQTLLKGLEIDRAGNRTQVSGSVALLPWQLPVLEEVRVVIGADAEPLPDIGAEPPPEPMEPPGVPVPVGRESC